jgi:hypothetical protein
MEYYIQTHEIMSNKSSHFEDWKRADFKRKMAQIALYKYGDVEQFYKLMNEADLLEPTTFFD